MLHEVEKKHVRYKDEKSSKLLRFPCLGTGIGYFCQFNCFKARQKRLHTSLGSGMTIYFKQLKNLMILNLICTVLSIPSYILFWRGKVINNPQTNPGLLNFNELISSLSLANLGDTEKDLIMLDLDMQTQQIALACEGGNIGRYEEYFIAGPPQNGQLEDFDEDSVCQLNFKHSINNYEKYQESCYEK